jgi:hypothetical protein
MASTVFILGAGASKEAGAPLMADFLDHAERLLAEGRIKEGADAFKKALKARDLLQAVHSKAELDLVNIESVFSALEMAQIIRKLPGADGAAADEALVSLKELIVRTLEHSISLPVANRRVGPPPSYKDFVELLNFLRSEAQPKQSVAVLTFNYDVALDFTLFWHRLSPRYFLDGSDPGHGIPLLKLHGSLNWALCPRCNSVVPWTFEDYFKRFNWPLLMEESEVRLNIGSDLNSFEHCGTYVGGLPFIVPPTWSKTQHHGSITKVWAQAARELSEAENIYVLGYSLPESDAFFRQLYALGTAGGPPLKRFWIYDPDASGKVRQRFSELIGPGARNRFQHHQFVFTGATGAIGRMHRGG